MKHDLFQYCKAKENETFDFVRNLQTRVVGWMIENPSM